MSLDPNYKAIFVILNDIESHELIQFNKEYLDEEFFENFVEFEKAFSHSIDEVFRKLNTFQTNHEEIVIFAVYSELSFINFHLEAIKKILKIIINSSKIKGGFDNNTTLEQMIKRICNKMQYPEKLKKSIKGLFLVDFTEAISHQEYRIYKNGSLVIYPKDEKMKKILNINDLVNNASQVTTMFDAMLDWSDGKQKTDRKVKTNEKTKGLLKTVKDLIEQIESLDKKLDGLS